MNAPQCYIIRTFPVSFNFSILFQYSILAISGQFSTPFGHFVVAPPLDNCGYNLIWLQFLVLSSSFAGESTFVFVIRTNWTLNTMHSFIVYNMFVPDDGRYKQPKRAVEDKWMRIEQSFVLRLTIKIYINFSISHLDFHFFWVMLTVHKICLFMGEPKYIAILKYTEIRVSRDAITIETNKIHSFLYFGAKTSRWARPPHSRGF
jgi:hypothetical protein